MLAGLEDVDTGSIRIGDRDVTHVAPKDRDIAMVFQSYALYPHMTVAENMGFALKIAGVSKDERARRVQEAAKLLDLEPYLDRKPKALSGGQRQRVAMGRAIVREPQVFLMDEPLSNLDAKLRVATRTQIAALQRRLGITTVRIGIIGDNVAGWVCTSRSIQRSASFDGRVRISNRGRCQVCHRIHTELRSIARCIGRCGCDRIGRLHAKASHIERAAEIAIGIAGQEPEISLAATIRTAQVADKELDAAVRKRALVRCGSHVTTQSQNVANKVAVADDWRVDQQIRVSRGFGSVIGGDAVSTDVDSQSAIPVDRVALNGRPVRCVR